MPHDHTLQPATTALLISDMQEGFRPVIFEFDRIVQRIARVAEGCALLGVPVLVTEQYPKGLGRTVDEIKRVLPPGQQILEKTAFSACGASSFVDRLKASGAKQVLVCGIEAHICVNQSVHDLLAAGYQVHLLGDCISSRTPENRELGLSKMLRSGALPSGLEMALFELMRDARHEQFKAIQKLVK